MTTDTGPLTSRSLPSSRITITTYDATVAALDAAAAAAVWAGSVPAVGSDPAQTV
ncbi:MAG: hypothetical protein M3501_05500 [Actinomycetota bacterium]|nr:hypothetical protein [Actinomycetota bacterium]